MLTVEQIAKALRDRSPTIVGRVTGLHPNTIRYIRDGLSKDPGHSTVRKLSEYIESTLPEQDNGGR